MRKREMWAMSREDKDVKHAESWGNNHMNKYLEEKRVWREEVRSRVRELK